jgi:cation:H+ antiporter
LDFIIFVVSLFVLIYGAEFVIRESEKIALYFNISSFVIGASLIAFGTSLPEFAASIRASYVGKSEIALSNVVGSVTLNIVMVLGIVFLVAKELKPKRDLFNLDSAWIFIPVALFVIMIQNAVISRLEGFVYILLMVAYLIFLSKDTKELENEVDKNLVKEKFNWLRSIFFLVVGFVLVVKGADFTIQSASNIARSFGVSEWIIGLLMLAFGTSLPELVVSIKAALKGNAEMSIGNIIGSNVANFSMVLGGAALINPIKVNFQTSMYDIVTMVIVSLIFIFILANRLYSKSTGVIFLSIAMLTLCNAFGLS